MLQRVDFSANSKIYDCRHGGAISGQLAGDLADHLQQGATIIDIGAGTGRVSVALGSSGFRVIAVEPAIPMLQAMRQKPGATRVLPVAAEGSHLPFRRNSADAIVVARLLYLVADWKALLREAAAALKRAGILFHEWGNGDASEAWVQVRETARSLFQEAGVETPFHPGARSEIEVDSYLRSLGFVRKKEIKAGAGPAITLADFLNKIESAELSYVWNVPKGVQDTCLPRLKNWCEGTFDLNQPLPIPAELHWVVYENVG